MGYLSPTIAGATLFVAAFSSLYLNKTISTSLMVLMALAAILISLPAIRRFQLSKDGFSIEPAEALVANAAGNVVSTPTTPLPSNLKSADAIASAKATLALGLAFLYGAVSGVASGVLPISVDPTQSIFPAPIGPPIFFSVAAIAFLSRIRPVQKLGLAITVPSIFVGWVAAYNVAFFLMFPTGDIKDGGLPNTWANAAAIGLCAGITGALLMAGGLSIGFRHLRSVEALSVIIATGALAGLAFAPAMHLPNVTLTGNTTFSPGGYLLFVTWQSLVLASVAYASKARPRP